MKRIVKDLLRTKGEINPFINARLREFKKLGTEGETTFDFHPFLDLRFEADLFSELAFCLLTANFPVDRGIYIQGFVGREGFRTKKRGELESILRDFGHRFPAQRAQRIVLAREDFHKIEKLIGKGLTGPEVRERLANDRSDLKVYGLGYKEASHFLRNIGFEDVAIIDRHLWRFLVREGLIEDYRTLTSKRYLQAEEVLRKLGGMMGCTLAELDLIIFHRMTGRVLK